MSYFKKTGYHSSSAIAYLDPESEYFSVENWKRFMEGTLEDQESKALITGTNIHNYLESPEEFRIFPIDKPTDKLGEVADKALEILKDSKEKIIKNQVEGVAPLTIEQSLVLALNDIDYYRNLKPETRLSKALDVKTYIETFLEFENEGYQILSKQDKEAINGISNSIRSDGSLYNLFFANDDERDENTEIKREIEIYFEFLGEPCKSKLDLIVIDHQRKIISIKDIKSYGLSSNIYLYPYEFYKRKVYRQLAFYRQAVEEWKKENNLENYTVTNCSIIACSKKEPYMVKEFAVSFDWLYQGVKEINMYFKNVRSISKFGKHTIELDLQIPKIENIQKRQLWHII